MQVQHSYTSSINEWLNLSYSRPHAFRYGNQRDDALLLNLELTNSDLVGIVPENIQYHPG